MTTHNGRWLRIDSWLKRLFTSQCRASLESAFTPVGNREPFHGLRDLEGEEKCREQNNIGISPPRSLTDVRLNPIPDTLLNDIIMFDTSYWGTRWLSWLRHWATNRKVAGSIPDAVTAIFQWFNPSGSIMALGWTQNLTEMSTRTASLG